MQGNTYAWYVCTLSQPLALARALYLSLALSRARCTSTPDAPAALEYVPGGHGTPSLDVDPGGQWFPAAVVHSVQEDAPVEKEGKSEK